MIFYRWQIPPEEFRKKVAFMLKMRNYPLGT